MLKTILRKEIWPLVLTLVVVGGFVYSFNLNNKLFWDDEDWIIRNDFVHTISWDNVKFWLTNNVLAGVGLKSNYYRPFLFLTFALNYMVAGIKPLAYHLTSNSVHIFNGILVFWLVHEIFKRKLFAFLVSILFLIHPLQTEAITYISGRGDALVVMFMLLTLILFYKSESAKHNISGFVHKKPSTFYFLLSTFFLVLGLLSRETGIVFPFLALAFYVSFISKDRFVVSIKRGLVATWPYFVVVLIYGVLRLTVLNFQNTLNFYTAPNIYSENLYIRILTFLPILWEYLKLLMVPVSLHMERSAIVYTSLFQWPVWFVSLFLLGLVGWLVFLYKKEKRAANRNPKSEILNPKQIPNSKFQIQNITDFNIWLFGSLWFFIALGPVSGITPISALMYEHWLYLPMIGFWFITSFYLVKLLDYKGSTFLKIQGRTLVTVGLVIYLSFFVYQSIQRNILWGNREEFYKNILKYEPGSSRINNNLGTIYLNQNKQEQAEFYYQKAIESGDMFAQPYFNLGTILQSKGDMRGAIKMYEKATEVNPNFYYPYQNLSVIYAQQGNLTKAVENIEKLKLIIPNNPRVYYNSALVYTALKNKAQALKDLQTGLRYVGQDSQTGDLIRKFIVELQK